MSMVPLNKPSGKVIAIIQARMGSQRLANKMMLHLHGYPVVEWVYRRVLQASLLDEVICALPDTAADDLLHRYLDSLGATVFRGSEHDLVARFHAAAHAHSASHVVRVCADNPLIAASEIDNLICYYAASGADYVYNHIPRNNRYPDGLGAEIAPVGLLDEMHSHATTPQQREHLFNYIWENRDNYRIETFDPPDEAIACPNIRLDIDTLEDYARLLTLPLHIGMNPRDIISLFGGEP